MRGSEWLVLLLWCKVRVFQVRGCMVEVRLTQVRREA